MKVLVLGAAGKTGRAVVEQVGDATDADTVAAAVTGEDAVVDTVGGKTPDQPTTLETDVATAIVAAMQQHGVRRLVVTSVVGEGDSIANTPAFIKELAEGFLSGSTKDKAGMEDVVRASGLDWIITRADLAAFTVAQLTSDDHLQQAVTIANH